MRHLPSGLRSTAPLLTAAALAVPLVAGCQSTPPPTIHPKSHTRTHSSSSSSPPPPMPRTVVLKLHDLPAWSRSAQPIKTRNAIPPCFQKADDVSHGTKRAHGTFTLGDIYLFEDVGSYPSDAAANRRFVHERTRLDACKKVKYTEPLGNGQSLPVTGTSGVTSMKRPTRYARAYTANLTVAGGNTVNIYLVIAAVDRNYVSIGMGSPGADHFPLFANLVQTAVKKLKQK